MQTESASVLTDFVPSRDSGRIDIDLQPLDFEVDLQRNDRNAFAYENAVMPKTLAIHETYNPGAVDKVTVFDADGEEVIAWEGED